MKKNLKQACKDGIAECVRVASVQFQPYNYEQIKRWIWKKGESDIDKFTDISISVREVLKQHFEIKSIEPLSIRQSTDKSTKFLFSLLDNAKIEAVFIPDGKRKTICVSSQSGCALQCSFCATGRMGFKRNLFFWEILDQVRFIRDHKKQDITNVVFMGMGEPMLNMEEVLTAIDFLTDSNAFQIGARKITVSTSGIIPGIRKLSTYDKKVKLAVSLNSAIQEKREEIMPIAKTYRLKELKKALLLYYQKKKRWITFEYIHLPGFNDGAKDVQALRNFISGLPCKINIIPYNTFAGSPFREPTRRETTAFIKRLYKFPVPITLRESRGRDIEGACGQLAYAKKNHDSQALSQG